MVEQNESRAGESADGCVSASEDLILRTNSTYLWVMLAVGFMFTVVGSTKLAQDGLSYFWLVLVLLLPIMMALNVYQYFRAFIIIRGDLLTMRKSLFRRDSSLRLSEVADQEITVGQAVLKREGQESFAINLTNLNQSDVERLVRVLQERIEPSGEG